MLTIKQCPCPMCAKRDAVAAKFPATAQDRHDALTWAILAFQDQHAGSRIPLLAAMERVEKAGEHQHTGLGMAAFGAGVAEVQVVDIYNEGVGCPGGDCLVYKARSLLGAARRTP
jgi:hypothetical protein